MEAFVALCSIVSLPVGVKILQRYSPTQSPVSAIRAITVYGVKIGVVTELWLVVFSAVIASAWHIPLAVTALQLVFANLLFLLLLWATTAEPKPHYTKESTSNVVAFGLLAAGLVQANFLLYFARSGLSSQYASTNNPYYFKATTIALLTLVLCQCINILLARAAHHKRFFTRHLVTNKKLLWAFGFSLFGILTITYVDSLAHLFNTGSLTFWDWLWAIVAASIYLGFRLLQRHTRQHTHKAVLDLHRKVTGGRA